MVSIKSFSNKTRIILFSALFLGLPILFYVKTYTDDKLYFISGNKQTTLIELFTSQGCSSCPPAERWFSTFKEDPKLWKEIVPVAFHVDYWNYLGWKDPYSSPEFSQKQRDLYRIGKIRSVYTPCFIVNGIEWQGWRFGRTLPKSKARTGLLKASLQGRQLSVAYEGDEKELTLNVAVLGFGLRTDVTNGENIGRTLTEDFVVLLFQSYTSQDSKWSIQLPEDYDSSAESLGLALWVNRKDDPEPLQATGGWLRKD